MAATFEFVGKIKKIERETEKFKAFEEKHYESGWCNQTFKFYAVNGNNSHVMQIKSGFWTKADGSIDESKMKIYTQSKSENGKSKSIEIAYANRTDPETVANVAFWRKYGINLSNPSEAKDPSKDYEFVFEGDFMNALRKLMDNPKFAERKISIKGDMDIQYGENNDTFYKTFIPRRIRFARDEEPEQMKLSLEFIYGPEAITVIDDDYIMVDGFHKYYDGGYRKDACRGMAMCPIRFAVRDKNLIDLVKHRFTDFPDECRYTKTDVTLNVINGTQEVSLTYDDLSDEAKENVDFGLSTLEDEIKRAGGTVYGDRITEYRFAVSRNKQATAYEDEDFYPPRHDGQEKVTHVEQSQEFDPTSVKTVKTTTNAEPTGLDGDFDLFGDL